MFPVEGRCSRCCITLFFSGPYETLSELDLGVCLFNSLEQIPLSLSKLHRVRVVNGLHFAPCLLKNSFDRSAIARGPLLGENNTK